MGISQYIKEIGRGKQGARSLSRAQATDLFGQILDGTVSDLELGGFCLAMRIKGETAQEMAGFLDAMAARLNHVPAGDKPLVVLPSYNGARKLPVLTPLLALLLVPAIGWLLYRTPAGLAVRMVGENPASAEGQGISVARTRTAAIVAGSALMGVAGSFLTLAAFNAFFFNMVNGRGWICVALVVFASWRPGKALLGALLFAFFDALQLRLQQQGDAALPYQLYLMLPYLLSILALVLVARKAAYPQALMKPYRKGER